MSTFTVHLGGLGNITVEGTAVVGKWDGSGKILLYNCPSLVGPQGPPGPPGQSGNGSGGSGTYVHAQAQASAQWTISHGLGKFPSVEIVDSSGRVVEGDIDYVDANTLTVSFSAAFAGDAYLN